MSASTWITSRLVPVPANTRLNLARRAMHSVEVAAMFDSLHAARNSITL